MNGFSVLMSVYLKDNPFFFKEALESIWNRQTLKPSEIVVVEDGPIGMELEKVLNGFSKKAPLKRVKIGKNQGLGNALKVGINNCAYDIIARMDSDDISISTRFEKQWEVIKNDESIDVLGALIEEFVDEPAIVTGVRKVPKNHIEIVKAHKLRNAMNHVTIMAKKEAILAAGNYETVLYFEDYFLWAKMMKKDFCFHNIQTPLVKVRSGRDMLGRRKGMDYVKLEIGFFRKLKEIGFISRAQMLKAILVRVPARFFPKKLLSGLYKYILREKVERKKPRV